MTETRLEGAIVPLVTPFTKDESVDLAALGRLIDFVLEQGAEALMPTALTGEGPLLTDSEKITVWEEVLKQAGGRAPVAPAIIALTTRQAVELVRVAERLGAAAVMAAPILPELYAGRSQDDVFAFYADLAAASALPLILFNYPSLTGIDFTPPLVARLSEIPNVKYIKESSGDIRRVHGLQRLLGERIEVICGAPNVALESLCLGCRSWITGIMNDVPRSARQLMQAVHTKGDLSLARRIYYRQILPLVDVMVRNFNPTGTIKAGVSARGVAVGGPRRPGHSVGPEDGLIIGRLMEEAAQAEAAAALELAAG
ncbi:MAG: dihydrodipicolinate synthase family protein [Thermodesulfobacteriota bacterium]